MKEWSWKLVTAVVVPALLLAVVGCGPQFFSAKGALSSSGGALGQWSSKPVMCERDEFDGDSSKLVTFLFSPPVNNDPDRNLHRDQEPQSPMRLRIAKNGDGYMARLEMMKEIKGVDPMKSSMGGIPLDSSTCKVLKFDRTEHSASMSLHKQLSGEVDMDCTVMQSHIVSNLKFNHCGM